MSSAAAVPPDPAWSEPAYPTTPPKGRRWHTVRLLALGAAVGVAGVPLGLLWSALAPDVPVRAVEGGIAFGVPQPEQVVAADGWFALLAVPFGALAAAAAWRVRSTRGAAGLLALIGGAVAAGVVAWLVGRQVGLSGYEAQLAGAAPGTELARPPDLRVVEASWWPPRVTGAPLVPALTAAVAYTVLAAWSRFATLRPSEQPYTDPWDEPDPGTSRTRGEADA